MLDWLTALRPELLAVAAGAGVVYVDCGVAGACTGAWVCVKPVTAVVVVDCVWGCDCCCVAWDIGYCTGCVNLTWNAGRLSMGGLDWDIQIFEVKVVA